MQKFSELRTTLFILTNKRNVIIFKLQGVWQRSAILWKPRMPTKTINEVRKGICTCCLGMDICFFTFRMDFELRGEPAQPPTCQNSCSKLCIF